MEKFHKYCLSVLLVIICSNISAQISSGNAESEDCKQLYELYHQMLNHHDTGSEKVCEGNAGQNFGISQKQNAIDLIGKIFKEHESRTFHKNTSEAGFSQQEKHTLILKNFERKSKEPFFARILYFKTKVSKVRNKDYLNIIG
ncbi:hypothetical protein FY557_12720 [Chryseobacterium sp. SN22]|uniref:hypothetical protein n=1 Tax=Chryseobacterium sp. SN22 TaxID=2606431 RepID=UPI0011EC6E9C|nr:hypothetical protein [Chryseobacterium sp. SN22]KAA0127478.1 hypothetical protein FY557_12720 [Chryseobacterium sp. SN22]